MSMWIDRSCLSIFAAVLAQYRLVDSQSIHFDYSPPNQLKYSSAKYNRNNCTSDASLLAKLIDGPAYNKHRIPGNLSTFVVNYFKSEMNGSKDYRIGQKSPIEVRF
uniref:Uncharacterized protein n=1 Tax=Parascaris equorum TaxID=6256 RepID=A0A914RS42_PAREQ